VFFTEGGPEKVDSTAKIVFLDAIWTVRVTEISSLNFHIVYDLIDTDPASHVSGRSDTIRLTSVTDNDHTFI